MYIWNANTSQYSPIGGSSSSSSSGSGSTSGAGVISLTYSELSTLVSGNTLVPGQKYLINDYQTVHLIPNTSDINTGPIEPLLVTASSTKTLEPIAYSTLFPQDIIYYNIESDQNIVSGSTKGYIYRRIDTIKNNDIGFDYRNVKFRRWQINVTTSDLTGSGNTYSKGSVVLQTNTSNIYFKLNNTPSVPFTNTSSWMLFSWSNLEYINPYNNNWNINNYTIPVSTNYMDYTMFSTEPTTNGVQCNYDYIYENKIKGICDGSDIISNLNTVFFGSDFQTNTIGDYFTNNTIEDYFSSNTIGDNFTNNIVGNNFQTNTIGYDFYNNTIGDNFQTNTIEDYFANNTIEDYFTNNTIGENFTNNTIGDNFQTNTIGDYFANNIVGNSFQLNNIENNFSGKNFTSSVYVYQPHQKYLFTNSANGQYLRYYDANNVLQIVQATL
jgi:hypothetical protein